MKKPSILIVTGELSGFVHAKPLAEKLKESLEVYSVFPEEVDGVANIFDAKKLTAFGLFESLKKVPSLIKGIRKIKSFMKENRPDAVLLIDFPGFNLKLAREAKKIGIKVLYFISPKFWAWGSWRIKKAMRNIDRMFVIFPFEVDFYKKYGYDVTYVGNPLVDLVRPSFCREKFFSNLRCCSEPLFLLMPGSRESEVKRLLKPMLEATLIVKQKLGRASFVIPVARTLDFYEISAIARDYGVPCIPDKFTYDAMFFSSAGIIASGTASLEAALALLPHVVVYKLNPLTFFIAKRVVKTKYISLPNIIADEKVVQELIQGAVNPPDMAEELLKAYQNMYKMKMQLKKLVKQKLKGGAIDRLSREILKELEVA